MVVLAAWLLHVVYPFYVYQLYINRAITPEPKLTWWEQIMAFVND